MRLVRTGRKFLGVAIVVFIAVHQRIAPGADPRDQRPGTLLLHAEVANLVRERAPEGIDLGEFGFHISDYHEVCQLELATNPIVFAIATWFESETTRIRLSFGEHRWLDLLALPQNLWVDF